MPLLPIQNYETEVLVIGSGAAGTIAAVRAADIGARVLLISKGTITSGATVMARSGFQAAVGHSNPDDSPEIHYQDTIKAGELLNDKKLVRIMAEGILEVVRDLESWGVELVREGDRYSQKHRLGCTYPRHLHHYDTTGQALMKCLTNQVKLRKLPVMPHTFVIRLLAEGNKVIGALALDAGRGELIAINAKSVVLTAGGGGHVFALTDNPPVLTGDGYALAYEAGLELVDMEMIDFQLAVCYPDKIKRYPPNSSAWISAGARLYNGLGERFMRRYDPEKLERTGRAMINRAIGRELFEGRGTPHGGVYLDLSDIPEDEIVRIGPSIARTFQKAGVDLNCQPMELAPGAHTFLGGVRIASDSSTSMEGLFAAGEVTGGIHGANRLGGNAVTEPLVFGALSGVSAARHAQKNSGPVSYKSVETLLDDRLIGILNQTEGSIYPAQLKKQACRVMSEYVGIVRSEGRLKEALAQLAALEDQVSRIFIAGGSSIERVRAIKETVEAVNIITAGKIIATSALVREESRGTHFRSDFPRRDDENWVKHVAVRKDGNQLKYRFTEI